MKNEYDPIKVGKRINQIRTKLGLSMDEFASKIDSKAKSGTVSNWETGKNLPNNKRLKKIAELAGIRPKYLLTGNPYDNLSEEEINEMMEKDIAEQSRQGYIHEFKEKKYVQIEDFLNSPYERAFYINGHKLEKEEIEMLIKLFEGKEKNYPNDEEIEKDYNKMRNEYIKSKEKNEGDPFFFKMSDSIYFRFHK